MSLKVLKMISMLSVLGLLLPACVKSNEPAQVTLTFDSKTLSLAGKRATARKVFANAADTGDVQDGDGDGDGDGGHWGLETPTSLTEIQCFAAFVGADEAGLNESQCQVANGKTFKFNPILGLLGIGDSGSLQVPAGANRNIYILGFSSATGRCVTGLEELDRFAYNYSPPVLLGQRSVAIKSGENFVTVPLRTELDSGNEVGECDFYGEDRDSNISLTSYESKRSLWVRDNDVPRTVQIAHDGVSAECSRDGGETYASCGSSFVWKPEDLEKYHHVRVTMSDGTVKEKFFRPLNKYPGLEFIDCDETISTSGNFTELAGYVATAGKVICIANGVSLQSSGAPLAINQNGVTLITPQGGSGSSITGGSSSDVMRIDGGGDQVRMYGMNIKTANGSSESVIQVELGVLGLHIEDSHIFCDQCTNDAIVTDGAGSEVEPFRLRFSTINYSSPSGTYSALNAENSSFITIENSNIVSDDQGRSFQSVNGSQINVSDSVIKNYSAQVAKVFSDSAEAALRISKSIIVDGNGTGIVVESAAGSAFQALLEINGNTIVRGTGNGAFNSTFVLAQNTSASIGEKVDYNQPNYFCKEAETVMPYFANMTNMQNEAGNWSDANQLNPGSINETCSPEIKSRYGSL